MRIALAQVDSGTDKARNLARVREATERAADDGARLVVFPEYSMYEKKMVDATFASAAEPLDGRFATGVREVAARRGVTVAVGIVERAAGDGRPFNTVLVVGPDGQTLARYRKVHLFDSAGFRESAAIHPADDLGAVTFAVDGLTAGLMTCYDLHFPEMGRVLADAGAGLVLVCSSWVPGPGKADQWAVLARARAIENGCFVAAVSQTPPVSIGRSLLVDPMGTVLGRLGEAPEVAAFSIDPELVAATRARNPSLAHRRFRTVAG